MLIVFVTLVTMIAGAGAFPAASALASLVCSITIGGGGHTYVYRAYLSGVDALGSDKYEVYTSSSVAEFSSVEASDFIRKTSGPCSFTVFNHANFEGRHVTLGSDLTTKIRAGIDGVENRDGGGGSTWRIRSIRMELANSEDFCAVRLGGNGVRMTYFNGAFAVVPAMNRLELVVAGERVSCQAVLYNSTDFEGRNRTFGTPTNAKAIDLGYRTRSLTIFPISRG
jgi:hypothetical protein